MLCDCGLGPFRISHHLPSLLRDLARRNNEKGMWLYGWKPIKASCDVVKFGVPIVTLIVEL